MSDQTHLRQLPESILLAIEAGRVPSPPQVLLRLLQLVDDEQAGIGELAALVARDPGLATRLLSVANSPALRRDGELHSLEHCLAVLGTRLVRTIATCLSLQNLFDHDAAVAPDELARFWGHSLLVAELSRRIAQATGQAHPDETYLAGLLHNIGQLVLLAALGEPYARLLAQCGDSAALADREVAAFATHHGEIGAWLVDRWQLDVSFADGILFHHADPGDIAAAAALPQIVWLAHALAAEAEPRPELLAHFAAIGGGTADPAALRREALEQTLKLALALGIPVAADDFSRSLWAGLRLAPAPTDDTANAELAAAISGQALLQPLQQNLFALDSDTEILLSLKESARILFDLSRIAFLFPDAQGTALTGAGIGNQPALFRQIGVPLAGSRSLPARAANNRAICSAYDDSGPATPIDIHFARALGSPGLLCIPMLSRQQLTGVIVCGLTSTQHQRLARRLPWLLHFGRIAAAALTSLREAKAFRRQAEEDAAGQFARQARRIVHEAGNPLGIIKGYLKILDRKLSDDSNLRQELDILREEIDRVAGIVCRMSEMPEASGDERHLDLGQLIEELLLLYSGTLFEARGIRVEIIRPEAALNVDCDRDSLKQILLNLWKNTSEALGAGQQLRIVIADGIVQDGRSYIQLRLDDNGPGMPEAAMLSLQRPAAVAGATPRGIGLAMVGTLAARQGILVTCRSQPGQGTSIALLIPCGDDSSGRDAAAAPCREGSPP